LWKHVENIQKEYLERDRVVAYVTDIIIHMNPDGDNGGDSEHESTDTEDGSDCSPSEDMNLYQHSHCNVNDKCFCTDNSC